MSTKHFFLLTLFAVTLSFYACETDPCADKDCGTFGTCDTDGTCLCDAGYEYDANGSCTVSTEGKFSGIYSTADTCATTPQTIITYDLIVGGGSNPSDGNIEFTNFGGTPSQGGIVKPVVGKVDVNTITIARQNPDGVEYIKNTNGVVVDSVRYHVSGTGSINTAVTPKVISIAYKFEQTTLSTGLTESVNCKLTGKLK